MASAKSGKVGDMNIQTFVRIKPSKRASGYFMPDDLDSEKALLVKLPEGADYVDNSKLNFKFNFSGIINMNSTQDEVFRKVGVGAIENTFQGFNRSAVHNYINKFCLLAMC